MNYSFNSSKFNETKFNSEGLSLLLIESILSTDNLINSFEKSLKEFNFPVDSVQKQITVKLLEDEIRLADWLTAEQTPTNPQWYD